MHNPRLEHHAYLRFGFERLRLGFGYYKHGEATHAAFDQGLYHDVPSSLSLTNPFPRVLEVGYERMYLQARRNPVVSVLDFFRISAFPEPIIIVAGVCSRLVYLGACLPTVLALGLWTLGRQSSVSPAESWIFV